MKKTALIFIFCFTLPTFILAKTIIDLRVMGTTDLHVHIVNYDYYKDKLVPGFGLAKTAALIKNARKEVQNSMLFDNGDLIQGNPLGDYVAKSKVLKYGEIHPVYKAMNLLGYDAATLGNHEFNYGMSFLLKALKGANFPYTNANVYVDDGDENPENDQNYFLPYLILDRQFKDNSEVVHDLKVGIIGFTPPQIMQWDKNNLTNLVIVKDIITTAKKFVLEMKSQGADIIIAMSHSGIDTETAGEMNENASFYLSQVDGIDALLMGHAHSVFPGKKFDGITGIDGKKGTLNGVAAVMPGSWGSHLGIIDLKLQKTGDSWKVIDGQSEARPIFKRDGRKKIPLVEAEPSIVTAVRADHEGTMAFVKTSVGKTTAPINSFFALVADDPSIQIVTNAQKWYVEKLVQGTQYEGLPVLSAGAPFKAGGRGGPGYYTDVSAGDIAIKNVADLYIYPNTLRVVLMTGDQVREWLEMSSTMFNQINPNKSGQQELINPEFPSYNFDVIDGVSYEIDITQPQRYAAKKGVVKPTAHRIKNLMFDGKPVKATDKFLIATNNYRAGGGGNFPGLDGSTVIIEAPQTNRQVLVDYIFYKKIINPSADQNWRFTPVASNATVVFESSPSAKKISEQTANLTFMRIKKNGFAQYQIKLK
ncbi:MAG: bifunctional 2',3'-cyclic-nucleotide 2'-phosphodiesterase/3'-nucleotidase [Deltaproteobacteria bacterium]|jgi:2',3'-cyclic-nucleotide 2'-phosphodiesterase / 3'-nucleotidase|nr:bifunctional 2',3'-cyclic-nucleotide 2'-phosphodiesterase/3'-nucleotidase [Deltaproteobacteria bacterium]MBT4265711.1 bifunctional 2',3'-cyclic-nucleotide 2'-phosphodiesterase/3'-nucleotidase [Deltaproteobacteria bacterium]MBT4644514.1 bifunctional 2',3'-cyclic-nucleotide 2'-phosphodiesterase/3'-nucleotidase [Deltaproteobacteria bacterium]MBT6503467.1 bifunctional 2',3'-cyclic-nucleotide 2'-phosphodiesterase/3'-nucleotidase [Deltaproteobacteria bacterium]MBT7714364.1 bifunctional 2',3'-cycli